MFSVIIDERPTKKCRKSLGTVSSVSQYETSSSEIDHPPQMIELVIDSSSSDSGSESSESDLETAFWITELNPSEF